MKQWMKPKVAIEAFVANEYVAACEVTPNVKNGTYVYWDLFYDNNGSMVLVKDGESAAHLMDEATTESFRFGHSISANTEAYGFQKNTWYTNKTLYTYHGSVQSSRYPNFHDENYWTPVGTYDIYVSSYRTPSFYVAGTAPGGVNEGSNES